MCSSTISTRINSFIGRRRNGWRRTTLVVVPSNIDAILRLLYIGTCFLCAFMVIWILIFPSSWLVGRSEFHDNVLYKTMTEPNQVTSIDLVVKYRGHSAVHFCHTLPGALWAVVIPFQLHPTLRQKYKTLHRMVGYVFVTTSLLMMVGVGIIVERGLLYEQSFTDLPPLQVSTVPGIYSMAVWFVMTAIVSVYYATWTRQFALHRRFMIRHVASGLWVGLQRVLLLTVFNRPPFTRIQQRAVFGNAALLAIGICLACAELAIHCLDYARTERNVVKSKNN